ncbi:putative DNA replication factor [Trypanosoma rangeli]|uniref:Putative DNA replication factor n=1 Tax=Trypanosoma rangeli TaxID=5698 RepID=A0A3R7MUG3_TRYRA|nr:putative DNA replication factor [Trypanosoma rangeli]RNF11443.1 putative DNA replication factor [Trypanosoma rangeli]|eukprot:RNF11443.1 putative DNA replication factor [Trypanosoma rangeli]
MADEVLVEEQLLQKLRSFVLECCTPPQCLTSTSSTESLMTRSLWTQEIDCMHLLDMCPNLTDILFFQTMTLIEGLRQVCGEICKSAGRSLNPAELSPRLTHLPTVGAPPPSMPPPRGVLVSLCGTIVRMNAKRVVPFVHKLKCTKCGDTVEVASSPFDRASKPRGRCERKGCGGGELQPVGQVWMDYAECRLQQRSSLSGRLPRTLLVTLEDELTMKCTVGQLVEVIGILFPKWRATYPNSRPVIEPTVWALNISSVESYREGGPGKIAAVPRRKPPDSMEGSAFSPESFFSSFCKDKLRRSTALVTSVCPHLAGLFAPRMALILAVVGGTCTTGKSRMPIRSTIHCLFVGDPSTGKSQLLRFAAMIAPRSTSTTGIGSTSAGLTVAAAKENGEWVLEPGALVLSDGGVCVIDELRTVSSADRASLHEAMEQQTISVAKAGMVTKLRTSCSVISACNPPPKRHGGTEIGVGGPLLSRFDFIFLLWDKPSLEVDSRVATHILTCSQAGQQPPSVLSQEDISRYLRWIHSHYAQHEGPLLSDQAAELIKTYYDLQHRRGTSPLLADCVPVTIRLLESLVRITQAHAKLHLEHVCTEEDAALAIFLMEQSAHSLKCPLESLGPEVYTSSKSLEDYFLDPSLEGVQRQRWVLRAIVDVFSNCGSAHSSSEDAVAATWLEKLKAPSEGAMLPSQQSSNPEREGSVPSEAVLRSARRLEVEVSSPFSSVQTVIQYTPSSLMQSPLKKSSRRRDADEIMNSLVFRF